MSDKYREAGVDLEAGYESVRRIKSHVARTKTMGAIDSIGAFGGMFDLSKYGFQEPVLVSGTDGVGTKLMIAFEADKHDTIGIDAVAMCVNDVLVQGALPMFFLDYIAVGKNHPQVIEQIVKGVADGCVQAECALIGGETAEMPDMYDEHHYDLAGFCVGAVDRSRLLDGQKKKSESGENSRRQGAGAGRQKVLSEFVIMSGSVLEDRTVMEIHWPNNCLLVALERNGKEMIPRGKTRLMAGDRLTVMTDERDAGYIHDKLENLCYTSF